MSSALGCSIGSIKKFVGAAVLGIVVVGGLVSASWAQIPWNDDATVADVVDGAVYTLGSTRISRTMDVPDGATVTIRNATEGDTLINDNFTITFNLLGSSSIVNWEARVSGSNTSSSQGVVRVTGNGQFNVVSGLIENTANNANARAIRATGSSSELKIQGGTVSAGATTTSAIAISSAGNVDVTGGTVEATSTSAGVTAISASGNVVVSGGLVRTVSTSTGSRSIAAYGDVTISGDAMVSTNNGHAINVSAAALGNICKVTVNNGTVTATGDNTSAKAIYLHGTYASMAVSITGGTVSVYNGRAIDISNSLSTDGRSVITVSGGIVRTTGTEVSTSAIYSKNISDINITISGGTVSTASTSATAKAIDASGNVTITGTAVVRINNGVAINATHSNSTVAVSGGKVVATGNDAATRAIQATGSSSVISITTNDTVGLSHTSPNGFAIETVGSINLGNSPIISGSIRTPYNRLSVRTGDSIPIFAPTANALYIIHPTNYNVGQIMVSNGAISGGTNFINSFRLHNAEYALEAEAPNLIVIPGAVTPDKHAISVSANPTDGGTVTGDGMYEDGESVTVTAIRNSDHNFVNWTEGGSVVSTSASYTFPVTSNRTLVANFAPKGSSSVFLVTDFESYNYTNMETYIYLHTWEDTDVSLFSSAGPGDIHGSMSFFPLDCDGSSGSYCGGMLIDQLPQHNVSENYYPGFEMGIELTGSDDVGYGAMFDNVSAIQFKAKTNTPGVKIIFKIETVENSRSGSYADKPWNAYSVEFTPTESWQTYKFDLEPITHATNVGEKISATGGTGQAGDFSLLPYWGDGYDFTFDRKNATKITWVIDSYTNSDIAVSGDWADIYIDDVELIGDFVFYPHGYCVDCATTDFNPPTSMLLSDFDTPNGNGKYNQNALGYHWYTITDKELGGDSFIKNDDGIISDVVSNGRVNNGAKIEFEMGYPFTSEITGETLLPSVGIITDLYDRQNDIDFFDASSFSGIYFEYKTSGAIDRVSVEVLDDFDILYSPGAPDYDGEVFHRWLDSTGGVWKSVIIPFDSLVLPIWMKHGGGHRRISSNGLQATTLNLSKLAQLRFVANGGYGTHGSINIDNIRFVGSGFASILSFDRTVPTYRDKDAAVIPPSSQTPFEIAVGPNPVQKSGGEVKIFAAGKPFTSAALTIYDATGNVVRKIDVRDNNVMNTPARRIVGVWDLRDTRGRTVADGTYLLRGTVTTADGKREKVSVMVGVR